jgi:hypothetical protein
MSADVANRDDKAMSGWKSNATANARRSGTRTMAPATMAAARRNAVTNPEFAPGV